MDIASIRENATAQEVRTAKLCAPTQEGFVRFQAIRLILEGYDKEEVADADTEVFQVFIDELAKYTEHSEKKIVLVLDQLVCAFPL